MILSTEPSMVELVDYTYNSRHVSTSFVVNLCTTFSYSCAALNQILT